jgi:hypothetical protein
MNNDQVIAKLLNEDFFIPAMIAGGIVIIVAIKSIASVLRTFARERTRREIAAFIAEGSMSPEQGERLMKAGAKDC